MHHVKELRQLTRLGTGNSNEICADGCQHLKELRQASAWGTGVAFVMVDVST